jgi:hypothetical protein
MMNQFYRIFSILPYVQRFPNIKIHVWEDDPPYDLWSFALNDTSRWRFLRRYVLTSGSQSGSQIWKG